jgi:levanase/fructan beta-fructosidase
LPLEGHTWQAKDNWGYKAFTDRDTLFQIYSSFIKALQPLIQKGLSAAVYTQTTDVEVETNGLMTYDRKVVKMPADRLKALHAQLNAAANCCGSISAGGAPHDPLPSPTPQWRPVYHYTPHKNWTNDPNGLIWLNGEYLLYNQYNPFDYKWGHMSWGHAVSKDLVDWKELPVAIPEIMGTDTTLRFSGSAVWDKNNSSGFCTSPKGCLVAIYTADQPALKKESQFIAYSNDGGLSYTNYAGNPVIDLHMKDFRDPNVIRMEKDQRWLMTVALPNEHKVRFYGSHDLKSWDLLSEFGGDQGDTRNIWECPSLTPLPVDGDSSRIKWLLMVSSGNPDAQTGMQYFIGDFDGKTFTNNNPADVRMFVDYGSTFYAAIPWNNLPPGQHMMLGWLVQGATPTYPWTGQMSIPRDLSLRTTADGIRLFQEPAEMISRKLDRLSHGRVTRRKDMAIGDAGVDLGAAAHLSGNTFWIRADVRVGDAGAGGSGAAGSGGMGAGGSGRTGVGFRIASQKDAAGNVVDGTIVGYDAASHRLYIDKTQSGGQPNGYDSLVHYIPVQPVNGVLTLEILVDNSSLEVFAGNGARVYTTMIYPGPGADGLSLFAKGGDFRVRDLAIWNLGQ